MSFLGSAAPRLEYGRDVSGFISSDSTRQIGRNAPHTLGQVKALDCLLVHAPDSLRGVAACIPTGNPASPLDTVARRSMVDLDVDGAQGFLDGLGLALIIFVVRVGCDGKFRQSKRLPKRTHGL
jgi:hypothetical protein